MASAFPYKAIAEIGTTIAGFVLSILYFIYQEFPDLHWSVWQLLYVPFSIPLNVLLVALHMNIGAESKTPQSRSKKQQQHTQIIR